MPRQPIYYEQAPVRTRADIKLARDFLAPKALSKNRKADCPGLVIKSLNTSDYLVQHPGDSGPAIYQEGELNFESNFYWRVEYTEVGGVPYFKEFRFREEAEELVEERGGEIKGPIFEAKEELEEGSLPSVDFFSHLTEEDDD